MLDPFFTPSAILAEYDLARSRLKNERRDTGSDF